MEIKIKHKLIIFSIFMLAYLLSADKTFAGSLQKPPNNLGLIAYWSFNEGTSTQAGDSSGNGNNGTLTIMSDPPTATSGWGSGKLNGGINFDGNNGDVITISGPALTTTFTFSAWVKLSEYFSYSCLFCEDSTAGVFFKDGVLDYYAGGDNLANTQLTLNTWHHVVVVNNAGSQTFYVDGKSDGTGSSVVSFTAGYIGNDDSDESFYGSLDEVRVYNRALSASEALALYRAGSAKINANTNNFLTNGLVGLWSFNGGDMTSVAAYDRSGSGNSVTLVSSPLKSIGKLGQSLTFNGTSDYAYTTTVPTTATNNWSISAWINPANLNQFSLAVYNGNDSGGYGFGLGNGGGGAGAKLTGLYGAIAWLDSTYTFSAADQWYHVVMTRNSGTLRFYVNGVDAGYSTAATPGAPSSRFCISCQFDTGNNPSRYFNGKVDDVRVYDKALSTSEIKQLYLSGVGTKVNSSQNVLSGTLGSSLLAMWSFNGADFTDKVYDRGSGGNHGYVYNTATSTIKTIGKIGQAINIDGSSDFIATPAPNISSNTVTFAAWINSTAAQDGYTGIVYMRDPTQATGMGYSSSGANLGYTWSDNNFTYDWNSGLAIPNGEWVFAVIAVEPTKATAYLCKKSTGCTSAVNTLSHVSVTFDTRILIGADDSFAARYFNGKIDEVRIYNKTLTSSEVNSLYLSSGP